MSRFAQWTMLLIYLTAVTYMYHDQVYSSMISNGYTGYPTGTWHKNASIKLYARTALMDALIRHGSDNSSRSVCNHMYMEVALPDREGQLLRNCAVVNIHDKYCNNNGRLYQCTGDGCITCSYNASIVYRKSIDWSRANGGKGKGMYASYQYGPFNGRPCLAMNRNVIFG